MGIKTNKKSWYTSKTVWVNALAIVAIIAQAEFGFVISPEANASALALLNLILRAITKEEITW